MNAILLALLAFQAPAEPESMLERLHREVSAVVEKSRSSVVRVLARTRVEVEPGVSADEPVSFSGVVYTPDGFIVTGGSGLENVFEIQVRLAAGDPRPAKLVGSDRRSGVAVLKIDAAGLVPANFSDDAPLRAGACAIVVGNPFGMEGGAAVGLVGGLGRTIQVGGRRFDGMLQMTAPVHPGDCGGLVADARGRGIGLVHSRWSNDLAESGSRAIFQLFGRDLAPLLPPAPGILSFATPAESVRFSADRIIRHGKMVRGWAGLSLRPLDDGVRQHLKIPAGQGALVWNVDRSGPASRAGLKRRDILLTWDGAPVAGIDALRRRVAALEKETRVRVTLLRDGEPKEFDIDLKLEPTP